MPSMPAVWNFIADYAITKFEPVCHGAFTAFTHTVGMLMKTKANLWASVPTT